MAERGPVQTPELGRQLGGCAGLSLVTTRNMGCIAAAEGFRAAGTSDLGLRLRAVGEG